MVCVYKDSLTLIVNMSIKYQYMIGITILIATMGYFDPIIGVD